MVPQHGTRIVVSVHSGLCGRGRARGCHAPGRPPPSRYNFLFLCQMGPASRNSFSCCFIFPVSEEEKTKTCIGYCMSPRKLAVYPRLTSNPSHWHLGEGTIPGCVGSPRGGSLRRGQGAPVLAACPLSSSVKWVSPGIFSETYYAWRGRATRIPSLPCPAHVGGHRAGPQSCSSLALALRVPPQGPGTSCLHATSP